MPETNGDDGGGGVEALADYVDELTTLAVVFGSNPLRVIGAVVAAVILGLANTTADVVNQVFRIVDDGLKAGGAAFAEAGETIQSTVFGLIELNNSVVLGLVGAAGPFAPFIAVGVLALEFVAIGFVLRYAFSIVATYLGGARV